MNWRAFGRKLVALLESPEGRAECRKATRWDDWVCGGCVPLAWGILKWMDDARAQPYYVVQPTKHPTKLDLPHVVVGFQAGTRRYYIDGAGVTTRVRDIVSGWHHKGFPSPSLLVPGGPAEQARMFFPDDERAARSIAAMLTRHFGPWPVPPGVGHFVWPKVPTGRSFLPPLIFDSDYACQVIDAMRYHEDDPVMDHNGDLLEPIKRKDGAIWEWRTRTWNLPPRV